MFADCQQLEEDEPALDGATGRHSEWLCKQQQNLQDLSPTHPLIPHNKHIHNIHMGVDGLLQFLQPIIQKQHLSTLHRQTAAVDMMSWLYRACYTHAEQIRDSPQSTAYLSYIQHMLDLFQLYHINIVCVFDGRFVASKQPTVDKRRSLREANRKKARQMQLAGDQQQTNKYLNRCIAIDETIITNTLRYLRTRQIDYIVAPYEADSQIAKLYHLSLVDFAVCQDSDQIIYGVPVVLKLSTEGECEYLDINKAHLQPIANVFVRQFVQMGKQKRTEVAVLAGTDYLESIKGVGIKTAVKYISQSGSIHQAVNEMRRSDRFKSVVADNYERQALKAKLIFMLATSYNVRQNTLQFLNMDYVKEVVYDQFSEQDIRQIVGVNYGYDQLVSQGIKNPWNLQLRELSPLSIQQAVCLNMGAIHQKQMSVTNIRLIRQAKQSQQLQKSALIEEELMMMCQLRQIKARSQQVAQFKQQWQQAQLQGIPKPTQAECLKLEKFGDWVRYCPSQ